MFPAPETSPLLFVIRATLELWEYAEDWGAALCGKSDTTANAPTTNTNNNTPPIFSQVTRPRMLERIEKVRSSLETCRPISLSLTA
jgi:hypothetical protein